MPPEVTLPPLRSPIGDTPISRTAWVRRRALSLVAFAASLVAFAALRLTGIFPHRIAGALLPGASERPLLLYRAPITDLLVQIEVALLFGAVAAGGALLVLADRDVPGVRVRRGGSALALSAAAFAGGAVATHRAFVNPLFELPALRAAVVDPYRLGELALFFPVAVGIGVALPPLIAGLVRARAIPRYTSDRQRGLAALCVFVFAAVYSPPDLVTFAAFASPPFAGLAAGLAWCEFA